MEDRIRAIAGVQGLGFVVSVGQPLPKDLDYLTAIAIDDLVDAMEWLGRPGTGRTDRWIARRRAGSPTLSWGTALALEWRALIRRGPHSQELRRAHV